jgi:two-component system, OmpR family, alkaline phosphatase synthesis response regulator PhoP
MTKGTILIIEDEKDIRDVVAFSLRREGYVALEAADAEKGLDMIRESGCDLVLLDMMLPGIDGFEALRRIRSSAETSRLPVIMVTARSEDSDIVAALELGADDYVCKPFSPRVLVARVRTRLREIERKAAGGADGNASSASGAEARTAGNAGDDAEESGVLSMSGITLDPARHEATLDDAELVLSATEFALLEYFLSNPGRVFSRARLIDALHGPSYPVTDRSIDVQILGLRKKLASRGELIETVRGVGYRLKDGTRS